LVNSEGAPDTAEYRHSGVVPSIGPVRLRIRLSRAPAKVWIEPGTTPLKGEYKAGEWTGILPGLNVHSFLRVEV